MREQLEALEELARVDVSFRQIDIELEDLRSRLEGLRADVKRLQDLLARERAQLEDAERLRASTQLETTDLADRLGKSSSRYNAARTSRERDASQREQEVLRREKDERAAKTQEFEKLVGSIRESLARHESDLSKLQELVAVEETETKTQVKELEDRRNSQESARATVTEKIRPELLQRYQIVRARRGSAVAQVEKGICRGCHIALPPILTTKLYSATDLYQCPNCQRILVLRPIGAGG